MKQTMCFTRRLKIYTATKEQMEATIAAETNPEMKKAYAEMLAGCLQEPGKAEWYAMWRIELLDGTQVGDLCFKGLDEKALPEIGYGINEAYQGKGYATEAVNAVVKWALSKPRVNAVEAETAPDNRASQKVLKKCGFQPTGEMGEEGPRFVVSR
ncbi:ribosomal-protein-alanine N-acetyltransferase [Lachnospiraceae bacterium XBB1006]|nr:ribosomal-protein-alanine N-acetyltransferase [Lachnospiraceae bacterium XBB1006]